MKTIVNNLDTVLTICTYYMFPGESAYDIMEREYFQDEMGIPNPEFDFDHKSIVTRLAVESISYLENEVRDLHIVKSIKLISTHSPQFYNYTTDSYKMEVDFNTGSLVAWLRRNNLLEEVEKLKKKWEYENYGKWEPYLVVFINNVVNPDTYHECMWEQENEIYRT